MFVCFSIVGFATLVMYAWGTQCCWSAMYAWGVPSVVGLWVFVSIIASTAQFLSTPQFAGWFLDGDSLFKQSQVPVCNFLLVNSSHAVMKFRVWRVTGSLKMDGGFSTDEIYINNDSLLPERTPVRGQDHLVADAIHQADSIAEGVISAEFADAAYSLSNKDDDIEVDFGCPMEGLSSIEAAIEGLRQGKLLGILNDGADKSPLQVKLNSMATSIEQIELVFSTLTFVVLLVRFLIDQVVHVSLLQWTPNGSLIILNYFAAAVTIKVVAILEGLLLVVTLSLAFAMKKLMDDKAAILIVGYPVAVIPFAKYVFIVLKANDNGEGGTVAWYSLICRYAKVSLLPNQQHVDEYIFSFRLQLPTPELQRALRVKDCLEKKLLSKTLLLLVLMGTAMVLGYGILTLSMSIRSIVSGLQGHVSGFDTDAVVSRFDTGDVLLNSGSTLRDLVIIIVKIGVKLRISDGADSVKCLDVGGYEQPIGKTPMVYPNKIATGSWEGHLLEDATWEPLPEFQRKYPELWEAACIKFLVFVCKFHY